jgi:hypothetical protein
LAALSVLVNQLLYLLVSSDLWPEPRGRPGIAGLRAYIDLQPAAGCSDQIRRNRFLILRVRALSFAARSWTCLINAGLIGPRWNRMRRHYEDRTVADGRVQKYPGFSKAWPMSSDQYFAVFDNQVHTATAVENTNPDRRYKLRINHSRYDSHRQKTNDSATQ